ncbi:SdpI family protein [Microbacterium lushaniae]|nr:SdpI family protein [Microbacterium lushaniae]KAA9158681.1 SdpI family protein [Microbacterium lushaniae]
MDGPSAPLLPLVLTGLGMAAAGVLLVWLARRGRDGRLPRNQFAGVRTMLTLSSDAAWFPAQRAAASDTVVAGAGAVVGGGALCVASFVPLAEPALIATVTVLTLGTAVWMVAWVLRGAVAAQRAARAAVDGRG